MRIAPHDAWGRPIDLALTLDGGQTFTWWVRGASPGGGPVFEGLAGQHRVKLWVDPLLGPGELRADSPRERAALDAVAKLLDLDRDYRTHDRQLVRQEPSLKEPIEATPGLRIVRLSPWEALLSFILATHTHVPRIKAMLAALSAAYGPGNGRLPSPEDLARADERDFRRLRLGYRARYVAHTARRLAGQPDLLQEWGALPTGELRRQLMELAGVGRKVADCVMLFGYGRWDVFPVDRWVRRALESLYFDGRHAPASRLYAEAERRFGALAGLAQAHLFAYWRRRGQGRVGGGRQPEMRGTSGRDRAHGRGKAASPCR